VRGTEDFRGESRENGDCAFHTESRSPHHWHLRHSRHILPLRKTNLATLNVPESAIDAGAAFLANAVYGTNDVSPPRACHRCPSRCATNTINPTPRRTYFWSSSRISVRSAGQSQSRSAADSGPVGELELEHPNRVAHMQCDQCDWVSSKPRSMRIHRKVHERVWRQSGLPTRYCHRCGLLLPTSQNGSAHRELCDHFQLGNTVISHGSVDRRRSTRTSESTHRDRVGGSGGGNEAQAAAEATVETEEGYFNDESIQGDASHVRGYGGGSLALPVTTGSEQDSGWQQDDGEVNDSDLFENYGA